MAPGEITARPKKRAGYTENANPMPRVPAKQETIVRIKPQAAGSPRPTGGETAKGKMVRGASFSADEDTALARCWVGISAKHDEQDAQEFWSNVAGAFEKQPEASERSRVAGSLHSRWQVLQRAVQKYLAAERLERSNPVSGETEEDAQLNIMRFYRKRTRTKDRHGIERDGPALKSMGAVSILRSCPKFSAIGGTSASCALYAPGVSTSTASFSPTLTDTLRTPSTTSDDGAPLPDAPTGGARVDGGGAVAMESAAIPAMSPAKRRPMGVKKAKLKEKQERGGAGLSEIAAVLMEGSKRKTALKKAQLRFICINALPDGDTKTELLMEFLGSRVLVGDDRDASTKDNVPLTTRVAIGTPKLEFSVPGKIQ